MAAAGLRVPRSAIATIAAGGAARRCRAIGLPVIVRPAFTLGGTRRRRRAHARAEYRADRRARGIAASPIGQVLIDESVLGWGEFELEVMRDHADNVVIVCSIENLDPMGVHTGDSRLRRAAADAHRQAVPAAARPGDRRDPRGRRRDRRLQRAVRGQPGDRRDRRHRDEPARVALLARWPRRRPASRSRRSPRGWPSATRCRRSPTTSPAPRRRASSPTIDYCVVKWPRFAFEKFPGADAGLTTHMKSVGEAMAIGPHVQAGVRQGAALARARRAGTPPADDEALLTALETPRRRPLRPRAGGAPPRRHGRGAQRAHRRSTRGSCASCRSWRSIPRAPRRGRARVQVGRHLRRRVRGRARPTTTRAGSGRVRAAGPPRGRARRAARAS